MLLADQDQKWHDELLKLEGGACASEELKTASFSELLPRFTDGDFTFGQSNAILRYLARKYELYGANFQEAALLDVANDGVETLRLKYLDLIYHHFEEGKDAYVKDLPTQLEPFEILLSQNPRGGEFIVGNKISFVDYNLLDLLLIHLTLAPHCLEDFPLLSSYVTRLSSRTRIRNYLNSTKHTSLPINCNGKQ